MSFLKKLCPYSILENNYVLRGRSLGLALYHYAPGRHIKRLIQRQVHQFSPWENEYARRGYRTIPLEDFARLALISDKGYSLAGKLKQKRNFGEDAIIYSSRELPKISPSKIMDEEIKILQEQKKKL